MLGSLLLPLLAAAPLLPRAPDELAVVTTIPDLEDIVREIGGDRVEVHSLARGTENIHAVVVRPSDLVKMSRADLFVQIGLSLEHAYVPGLLQRCRNPRIQPDQPGFVNASDGWQALDVPATLSRGLSADLHPAGNPHMNLDPSAGGFLAQRILEGLGRVDPDSREYYEKRHAAYVQELARAGERWAALAERSRGGRVVTYHSDFTYFVRSRGIEVVATLEPKPGVPPTPRDLARVIETMKSEGVDVILTAKWSNDKSVRFVAEKTGARVLELPVMVGGSPEATSWIAMMDFLHERLADSIADSSADSVKGG